MKKKVLFVGDINVDLIMGGLKSLPIANKEIQCKTYETAIGSSGVIAACAYSALGGGAAFLGLAGKDGRGEYMLGEMEKRGIDTRLVRRTNRLRTGVTLNLVTHGARTQVTYPGAISAFDGKDVDASTLKGHDHIHFTGVYQEPLFRPHLTRLLRIAKVLGITTSLDPQWDATERWEGMKEWAPLLTWLFINEDEARSITRRDSTAQACEVLSARAPCPVVKIGRKGALLCARESATRVPSFRVRVVDTVGAGDNFDAGFLYAVLERRMEPIEATRFANAVAARSCMFTGGVGASSTYADIVKFQRSH